MKEVLDKLRKGNTGENEGNVIWKSPSNIALIKYWGKFGKQLPANPSLSFSLSKSFSTTSVSYSPRKRSEHISVEFKFEGKSNSSFSARIGLFLDAIRPLFPLLSTHHLEIDSKNSFPHSSGIASSASALSSLALCIVDIQNKLASSPLDVEDSLRLASYVARIGSGSACRSVYGSYSVWGKTKNIKGSSDLYAVPYPYDLHKIFTEINDDILLVDRGSKEISSSAGHELMNGHPFAGKRFELASSRLAALKPILKAGDMESFGKIVEQEALMLHAMMMTSEPYFILFKPNTISIVKAVWQFRKESGIPVFFTLDAGANVHLLYNRSNELKIRAFINENLLVYCENGEYLCDSLGKGPEKLI